MRLTDARTVCPTLGAVPHDRAGDTQMLETMADAMLRFTPWVALDGTDALILDITGCAHLQGGEAALAETARTIFARAGFTARTGLADTIGAAWAAARFGTDPGQIIVPGGTVPALDPMPVAALRLAPDLVASLATLGLKTVIQLRTLDRASLMRRFPPSKRHPGVVARLDQAIGRRNEPLAPRAEVPDYRVHVTPLEPLIHLEGVRQQFDQVLQSLLGLLASDGRGVRRLTLFAFRCDGPTERISIGLARATRTESHITRLFTEQFDSIDPGFGIDTLLLSAEVTEPLLPAQPGLETDRSAATPDALDRLIDRIANRAGSDSVYCLAPVASHSPDRAVRRAPATASADWQQALIPLRPLTLLARPETIAVMAEIPEGPPLTFRWRRVLHRVTHATGPERLAPEWWRDLAETMRTRDYYVIEDAGGGRYWLFRDGLYHEAARRGTPEWFLHGVFA